MFNKAKKQLEQQQNCIMAGKVFVNDAPAGGGLSLRFATSNGDITPPIIITHDTAANLGQMIVDYYNPPKSDPEWSGEHEAPLAGHDEIQHDIR